MKFLYKKLQTGISRPIIPIEVIKNNKSLKYYALIDSRADINVFHSEIGELLDINIKSGKHGMISGVSQAEPDDYFIHPVTIKVGG
ncbi:MAG: hypothetical protein ABH971_02130 [bacterium]